MSIIEFPPKKGDKDGEAPGFTYYVYYNSGEVEEYQGDLIKVYPGVNVVFIATFLDEEFEHITVGINTEGIKRIVVEENEAD